MKVVGIMCVRDEGDILPEVLASLEGKLDALYAYDDGSIDNTFEVLSQSPVITFLTSRSKDPFRESISRGNYHCLFEKIKKDFNEEVWIVNTMGDRFFLNKQPKEIVEETKKSGFEAVYGIQLDFLRHRLQGWTSDVDTFPNYPESLRSLCRWFCLDERAIIAYKVKPEQSFSLSPYPWPKGLGPPRFRDESKSNLLSLEMPFLEHQGRRSPNAMLWRLKNKSRGISKKINTSGYDLTKYEDIVKLFPRFYAPYKVLPWYSNKSLETLISLYNNPEYAGLRDKVCKRYFYWGVEASHKEVKLHPRWDI